MHVRLSIGIAVLGLLVAAAPALAHHAFGAEFDTARPIALRGTVTMMEWVNPHSWIHIDVKGPDGTPVNWMIEGGSPNSLMRLGFTKNALLPGMEIVVDGYQAKDGARRANGRDVTLPNGKILFLGSTDTGAPDGSGVKK